jgi:Tol biopolymer transport system component
MVAGLVLIAAGWTWFAKRNTIGEVTSIFPVTTYPGDESEPSLSPDGRQVAFSWGGEKGDNRDIYVKLLGEQQPLRLTTDPSEDDYPAWSPDGKHIAFIRHLTGTQAEIILISALGGPERILRRIRLGAWITGRMLAWSPDGKWLCFTTEVGTSANHALFLLSPELGAVRQLLPEQDNGEGDSSPAFSPDGRWLAFGRFTFPAHSELLLQRLSPDLRPEGAPLVVKDCGVNPKAPVWTPDGKTILFLEGARIMQAEIGGPARQFYASSSRFAELASAGSAARPRLVASLQNGTEEIWTIPLSAKELVSTGNTRRIVQSTVGEGHPRFSPDGRQLAFRSSRSGTSEI